MLLLLTSTAEDSEKCLAEDEDDCSIIFTYAFFDNGSLVLYVQKEKGKEIDTSSPKDENYYAYKGSCQWMVHVLRCLGLLLATGTPQFKPFQ